MGMLSLLFDLGVRLRLVVWTDSTATQGICGRQGLGQICHLDVQDLWIQQRLCNGDFSLIKVPGEYNPGDLFTKAGLSQKRIENLLKLLGCIYTLGRPTIAPLLRPRQEPIKQLGLNRQRWADAEDDSRQLYGEEELEEYLEVKGLPHWSRLKYKSEKHREPFPELEETTDQLIIRGERLARAEGGRSQLPWKSGNNQNATTRPGR